MPLEGHILDTFSLKLMKSGTESHGKHLISWKLLIKNFIVQIITLLLSINTKLNVEYRYDFGKIKAGLILHPLMDGFSGVLDNCWVEDLQMMKNKLIDGKGL